MLAATAGCFDAEPGMFLEDGRPSGRPSRVRPASKPPRPVTGRSRAPATSPPTPREDRRMRMLVALLALTMAGAAYASEPWPVRPTVETPNLPDNAFESDGDDPAIWVHPDRPRRSLVVTAVKDGGLRVYDLAGKLVQTIDPVSTPDGDGRINNVDVAYGLKLPRGGADRRRRRERSRARRHSSLPHRRRCRAAADRDQRGPQAAGVPAAAPDRWQGPGGQPGRGPEHGLRPGALARSGQRAPAGGGHPARQGAPRPVPAPRAHRRQDRGRVPARLPLPAVPRRPGPARRERGRPLARLEPAVRGPGGRSAQRRRCSRARRMSASGGST